MERFIFLDFDGVLNSRRYQRELRAQGETGRDAFGSRFDPQAIDALRMLLERSGAQLVITSSWRTAGLAAMRDLWQSRSLPGEIADVTPFYLYGAYRNSLDGEPFMGFTLGCRGLEIAEWLARHAEPDVSYVILDDEEDFLLRQASRLVRINPETGLTPADARKAMVVLK
ncbi:HAD domain-containing protein [Alistipes putredinis]|uniref:HAD domain-containing protein n=1 Tax=Alistipes putredinis TaxID=28117 RepID=UPI003A88B1CF